MNKLSEIIVNIMKIKKKISDESFLRKIHHFGGFLSAARRKILSLEGTTCN
jgi:hypothetical protein